MTSPDATIHALAFRLGQVEAVATHALATYAGAYQLRCELERIVAIASGVAETPVEPERVLVLPDSGPIGTRHPQDPNEGIGDAP